MFLFFTLLTGIDSKSENNTLRVLAEAFEDRNCTIGVVDFPLGNNSARRNGIASCEIVSF